MPSPTNLENEDFMKVFPEMVEDITNLEDFEEEPVVKESLKKLLTYTVPTGKKNRGLTVITSYKLLEKQLTPEKIKLANMLGWCVEMVSAFYISNNIC